jgi:ribonuclease HI
MRKFNVFIDGSCRAVNNKEKASGGWAYVIADEHFNVLAEDYGKIRVGDQNSTRAELEALYQALLKMKTYRGNCKFHIHTDYESMVDLLNGFAERRANRDYWDLIEPICLRLAGNYRISHVYSHNKNPKEDKKIRDLNKRVDKLANVGANSLTKAPVRIAI